MFRFQSFVFVLISNMRNILGKFAFGVKHDIVDEALIVMFDDNLPIIDWFSNSCLILPFEQSI